MSEFGIGDVVYDRGADEWVTVSTVDSSSFHLLSCGCFRVERTDGTVELDACKDHRVVTNGNDAD